MTLYGPYGTIYHTWSNMTLPFLYDITLRLITYYTILLNLTAILTAPSIDRYRTSEAILQAQFIYLLIPNLLRI